MGVLIETNMVGVIIWLIVSHPTWVCGLKPVDQVFNLVWRFVTPYVGVWIETLITCFTSASIKSHPAWEYMDWSIVHSSVKFMEEL